MNHVITLIQLMSIASHLELRLGQTSLYMIEGGKLFICVAMSLAPKYELNIDGTTRKPCRLHDKGSTFISRCFRSSLGGWDEHLICWVICAC